MSDVRHERFFCSECGQEIAGEFVEMLRRGEQVFCEACGSRITVKVQKKVGLPRAEKVHAQPTYRPPPTPPTPPVPGMIAHEPGMDEILSAQRAEIERKAQAQGKITKVPDWRASLSKTKKDAIENAIQKLNPLSLIIGVLIVSIAGLASLVSTAGTTNFYWHIALVACALGAIVNDVRFYNLINQKDYSFRGIDLIVWGFIGCFGYGVGALVLAKGLCVLTYTLHPNSGYPQLTRTQWFNVGISRLNANSIYVGFLIWSGTVPAAIATFMAKSAPEFIGFIVMGFIALLVDRFLFTPKLKQHLENRRSAELGLGMLAAGIIGTFDFAMGVVLLLKGLAVILLSGLSDTPQKPVVAPVPTEVPQQAESMSHTSQVVKAKKELPPVLPAPVTGIQERATPTPGVTPPKSPTPMASNKPAPVQPSQLSAKPVVPVEKAEGTPLKSEDFEKQAAIQSYLNRVYTVLSSKIRDRVQKLSVPENEKREIVDGLLNLTPQEQEQFLTELEELARRLMPEIVGRILRLNLSKEQNEVLLRQMEFLSDQEQLEFVSELERARLGAT